MASTYPSVAKTAGKLRQSSDLEFPMLRWLLIFVVIAAGGWWLASPSSPTATSAAFTAANGQPVFPPVGIEAKDLDTIQRELLQYCNAIQPPYFPVLSMEEFAGKALIVTSSCWRPRLERFPSAG